jgi:hypothetical protein
MRPRLGCRKSQIVRTIVRTTWVASSLLSLLQAYLVLRFNPESRSATFDRPVLPAFLNAVICAAFRSAKPVWMSRVAGPGRGGGQPARVQGRHLGDDDQLLSGCQRSIRFQVGQAIAPNQMVRPQLTAPERAPFKPKPLRASLRH